MSANFDTLAAVKRLVSAGFTELQVEGIVCLIRDVQQGGRTLPPWWRYPPTVAPNIATVIILVVAGLAMLLTGGLSS